MRREESIKYFGWLAAITLGLTAGCGAAIEPEAETISPVRSSSKSGADAQTSAREFIAVASMPM